MAPFQAQAQQQNKPFTFRMDVEYPMVLGDKVRLAQIMDNLLSNALKYTLPGDSISVTLSQAGADQQKLSLRGSGHGHRHVPGVFKTAL